MDFLTIITILGGIILTVGYIPQIIKLHSTQLTDGINNGFWYLISGAVTITALNLFIDAAPIVLITIQVINAALALYTVIIVHQYRRELMYPVIIWLVAILGVVYFLPLEFTQSLATGMIILAYVSQLITLFKAPSVAGVAPSLYLLIAIGLGIMATKMFVTEVSAYIITTEIVNIALLLTCAITAVYFQKKKIIN